MMSENSVIPTWIGIFATASTIAWAVAFASVYGPVSPAKSAKEVCALYSAARNTPFCMEIAKQQ